jgi:hypothetical protein
MEEINARARSRRGADTSSSWACRRRHAQPGDAAPFPYSACRCKTATNQRRGGEEGMSRHGWRLETETETERADERRERKLLDPYPRWWSARVPYRLPWNGQGLLDRFS